MKIKGYTLHGDYYLADEVITNATWGDACRMKEEVTLPNGKTVVAHTLSKEELETISDEEKDIKGCWYWTGTRSEDSYAFISCDKGFYDHYVGCSASDGGVRLGFKNPF